MSCRKRVRGKGGWQHLGRGLAALTLGGDHTCRVAHELSGQVFFDFGTQKYKPAVLRRLGRILRRVCFQTCWWP